ncbi:MAG TPA: hypothetical protein VJQ56_16605 [Blastocatellia bacterium]|nr:hypothetical protein [Blastocatellia bacterium]
MSYHSEEMWESFDALGRRLQRLTHTVRELEARLEVLERAEVESANNSAFGIKVAGSSLQERGAK